MVFWWKNLDLDSNLNNMKKLIKKLVKYRVFYSFSRTLKSYKKIIYDRLVTFDSLF